MGLEIDTNNLIVQAKSEQKAAIKSSNDNPISIFSLDNLKEHKTQLTIAGGIATVGLMGLSILTKKRIPKTLSPELLKSWATSTEPLTKKEVKIAQKELESFVNGLQLNTVGKKVKIKMIDTSGFAGGLSEPIGNRAIIDKTILTDTKMVKVVCEDGKILSWEFCGDGTNTLYPTISKLEELPAELQKSAKPLTKLERLNYAKSLAAHEAFHLSQFRRMLLHPDIGKSKIIEFIKAQNPTLTNEQIQRVINNKNINIFKRLLLKVYPKIINHGIKFNTLLSKYYWRNLAKEKPLNPISDIGQQTMKEYTAHRQFLFNTPTDPNEYWQAYTTNPIELGAYRFQTKIMKDLNLLS